MEKTIKWDHSQSKITDVTSIDITKILKDVKTLVSDQVDTSDDVENIKYDFTEEQRAAVLLATVPGNNTISTLVNALTDNTFEHPSEVAEFLTYNDQLSDEDIFLLHIEDQTDIPGPMELLKGLLDCGSK